MLHLPHLDTPFRWFLPTLSEANECPIQPWGGRLAESKGGVVAWRREGGQPRGGHIWAAFRDEFKGPKVTLAVSNFPMNNRPDDRFIPAGAHLSVWLEEMKLPPIGEWVAGGK